MAAFCRQPYGRRGIFPHWTAEEDGVGRFAVRPRYRWICRSRRNVPAYRLASRRRLVIAALFRFFRLHRHGNRPRLAVRLPLSRQFRAALSRAVGYRVLAALAYVAHAVPDDQPARATHPGDPAPAQGARSADQPSRATKSGRLSEHDRGTDRGHDDPHWTLARTDAAIPAVRRIPRWPPADKSRLAPVAGARRCRRGPVSR